MHVANPHAARDAPHPSAMRIDHALTLSDHAARKAMRGLAAEGIEAGESGGAGLAGLWLARDPALCRALGLGLDSRVLPFGAEGATDPVSSRDVVCVQCPV